MKSWKVWLAGLIVLATALVLARPTLPPLEREALIAYGRDLPGVTFALLFLLLPLLGVPIMWLLIIAGLKYGIATGMVVATAATGFHNLVAFVATKSWLQGPIERAVRKLGYGIPPIDRRHQLWFTAVFTGVPGLPYAVKLYSLALTNIPFKIYFWVGWPIYAVSCIVYVGLGDAAARLDVGWFIAIAVVALGLLYLAKRFLQKQADSAGL